MASHFQLPAERLSDNDFAVGFSFDARLANKQGQFTGPIPKSIIPGVQSAGQTVADLAAKSSAQRSKLPFAGLDFTSNLDGETAGPLGLVNRVNDQAQRSANENGSVSSHFSHGSDHDEPERENTTPSADDACDDHEQSIPFDIDICSPPPIICDERNVAALPLGRRERPPSGVSKDTSDTVKNIARKEIRYKERRYLQREHSQSQTPPSHCGDLEGFGIYAASNAIRTPPSHGNTIHRRQSQTHFERERSTSHRTHSRASNITRKRQSVPSDYKTSEPDRKRLAISEAVKYWNESMQISIEESERAKAIIDALEKKLHWQAEELEATKKALQTGNTSLEALAEQYKDLQARNIQSSSGRKDLQIKFGELSVDYKKLRTQVDEMSTKYSSWQQKLDGAVKEQQAALTGSRSLWNDVHHQMKQDEAQGKANAEAVEKALQASQQKRDELRKFVEQIQHDFQHQKSQCMCVKEVVELVLTNAYR